MARSKKTGPDLDIEGFKDDHLSLHVKDKDGTIRGETIGFDGDHLIIKKGDEFFKIKEKLLKKMEDHLLISGKVNWKKAKKDGEKWRKKELDPL